MRFTRNMTVRKNLSFGLETMGTPRAETKRRVADAAEILQIDALLDRRPGQLSGGQRQRVAIGCAIMREPRIFLFDEPLSNLDAELRVQMRVEINKLHRKLGATMIFVTHDQVEAMTLADRIVVLRAGRIEQVGTPLELYNHPANLFVAGFIGSPRMNFLSAEATAGQHGDLRVRSASGLDLLFRTAGAARSTEGKVTVGIRPENLGIADAQRAALSGEVQIAEHLGGETFLYIALASGETVVVEIQGQAKVPAGERVGIELDLSAAHIFDAAGNLIGRGASSAGSALAPDLAPAETSRP
jgi:multiple sugar transport system ATP-binding protein